MDSVGCRGTAEKKLEKVKGPVTIADDDDVDMIEAVDVPKEPRGEKIVTALKEKKRKGTQEKVKTKGSKRSAVPSESLSTQKRHKFGDKKPRKIGVQEMISPRLGTSTGESEMSGSSQAVILTVDTFLEDEDFDRDKEVDHESDQGIKSASTFDEELDELTVL